MRSLLILNTWTGIGITSGTSWLWGRFGHVWGYQICFSCTPCKPSQIHCIFPVHVRHYLLDRIIWFRYPFLILDCFQVLFLHFRSFCPIRTHSGTLWRRLRRQEQFCSKIDWFYCSFYKDRVQKFRQPTFPDDLKYLSYRNCGATSKG